jgi:hypothetical protein
MRKIFYLLALSLAFNAEASTSITTPLVSGHWTLAGSPYKIYNNIRVDYAQVLLIDPGVEVIFQGYYQIEVAGAMHAVGTSTNPVYFHAQDTTGWSNSTLTDGGWNGINFDYVSSDSCTFQYCNVADLKNSYLQFCYRNFTIIGCNVYHTKNAVLSLAINNFNNAEISNCNFYDNINFDFQQWSGNFNTHHNKFYNTATVRALCAGCTMLFSQNEMYSNTEAHIECTPATTGTVTACTHVTIKGNKIHHNTNTQMATIEGEGYINVIANLIVNNQHTVTGPCGVLYGGGGMFLRGTSEGYFNIKDNVIANNYSADFGGGVEIFQSAATITNNIIINNSSAEGAGLYIFNGAPATTTVTVKNNIISNNISSGMAVSNLSVDFWGDTGDTLAYSNNYVNNSFFHDIYFPMTTGIFVGDTTTNIIGAVPGLVSPTLLADVTENALTRDFSLLSSSPCINRGDTTGLVIDPLDYAGNPRVSGSNIDLGAYEFSSTLLFRNPGMLLQSIAVFPNPAHGTLLVSTPEAGGTIELRNILGNKVGGKDVQSGYTSFDVNELPRGTYFATWNKGGETMAVQQVILE